jgi:hypothetical protein
MSADADDGGSGLSRTEREATRWQPCRSAVDVYSYVCASRRVECDRAVVTERDTAERAGWCCSRQRSRLVVVSQTFADLQVRNGAANGQRLRQISSKVARSREDVLRGGDRDSVILDGSEEACRTGACNVVDGVIASRTRIRIPDGPAAPPITAMPAEGSPAARCTQPGMKLKSAILNSESFGTRLWAHCRGSCAITYSN